MAENIKNQNFTGIVVDDGSVRESILNKHGEEIGVFYFRPTDVGMIDRYNKMAADFDKITAPLENVDINPDGSVDETNAQTHTFSNIYVDSETVVGSLWGDFDAPVGGVIGGYWDDSNKTEVIMKNVNLVNFST